MEIRMQEAESASELDVTGWDLAVVGDCLDDRGNAAKEYLTQRADQVVSVKYDEGDFVFYVNGHGYDTENIGEFFDSFIGKSIILEATTLGFVEILLSCRTMRDLQFSHVDLMYVEPGDYTSPRRSHLLHKRDFSLSDDVPGYSAIPGATLMLTDKVRQKGVFFLGYEARRLDRALEDYQMIRPSNCCVVFGVPAFRPGWEMDAFANNIRVIRDKNIIGGVHFCGAENPAAAVDVLEQVFLELGPDERMFVAPIGTKPNGIGVALFISAHPEVRVLYDHPRRKAGRSANVSRWHLYEVGM